MGSDKALLSIEGRPMVERVLSALRQVTDDVVVVGAGGERLARPGERAVPDLLKGGPLAGIYSALSVAHYPYCLVVACDMPFLVPGFLRFMLNQCSGWDAVVPCPEGRIEPLHAVYAVPCRATIERMLGQGELCPLDLFPRLRVRYLADGELGEYPKAGLSFTNVNTPTDIATVRSLAAQGCDLEHVAPQLPRGSLDLAQGGLSRWL